MIIFWNNNKINPTLNSIAEKTKKKKVSANIFILSNMIPINKTHIYKDIHSNSAVNNKCNAVFTLLNKVKNNKKKNKNNKFISPYNIVIKQIVLNI